MQGMEISRLQIYLGKGVFLRIVIYASSVYSNETIHSLSMEINLSTEPNFFSL